MRMFKHILAVLLVAGTVFLAGCQTMTMPDMSKFNLDILKEKPVVAIKPGYSKVNIRPTPSTDQPPVANLAGGDKLKLHEEQGDWLKVTFYDTVGKEQEGWVYKYLVEGYDKPQGAAKSSTVSGKAAPPAAPETEAVEGEQETGEQELPKSKSVSPL